MVFGKKKEKKPEPVPVPAEPTPVIETDENSAEETAANTEIEALLKVQVDYYQKNYQGVFSEDLFNKITQNHISAEIASVLFAIMSEIRYMRYEIVKELQELRASVKE